jgi:D-aspartate ligase
MSQIPAIVTPLDDHMGLDIARSLARHNVPVYGIDWDPKVVGKHSRCCSFIQSPNPEHNGGADYLEFLVDFGKKFGRKVVLYPLSDMQVLLCSAHRRTLQNYYEYTMPDHETVVKLTTKDGLQAIASEFGIPAPQTILVKDRGEIELIANQATYPVILKPTESTYWHHPRIAGLLRKGFLDGRAKVILCENSSELLDIYHRVASYDDHLVVQEVVPGEDSRLVYFSFYLDRHSSPLGIFAGRKYRIIPKGFGSASYVRSMYDPELTDLALTFLSKIGYQGLGGIEFKKDARDERYKLIEFNTRFGMWDGLSVRCGVDLPYIAYCDTLNGSMERKLNYRTGVTWIDWQRDVRAAFAYWRQGELSFTQWMNSLRGEKMWAIYSKKDWGPGIALSLDLARKLWGRIKPQKK